MELLTCTVGNEGVVLADALRSFTEPRAPNTLDGAKMFVNIAGFSVDVWLLAVAVITVCVLLLNTDLFLTKPQPTSLDTFANAELRTTAGGEELQSAHTLEEHRSRDHGRQTTGMIFVQRGSL
ncbi:hypothetical protein PDJAM_G00040400 [Pangasius djambal]|uniref:Uncharacterized protein n=1 Tax=Pangasius djambal TaxID=1691987 RepID=A0ACC5YSX4_9TELE|nr:hypothetical protein [Pangasius djambal]